MKSDTGKELYTFPKGGDVEYERLEIQHQMWSLIVGGPYPQDFKSKVESLMKKSNNPAVLDVGCGSAIWSTQMACLFPQARVIGLDMTPLGPQDLPSNFSFKAHNLATGLPSGYCGKFDVIHCRTVIQHVPDPQGLVNSMAEALKPGGILFIADIELIGYDENREPLEPAMYHGDWSIEENIQRQEALSWHNGWMVALGSVSRSPRYQPPRIHVQRSAALKTLMDGEFWVPYGLVAEEDEGRKLSGLATENLRNLYVSTIETFARTMSQVPERFREALVERGLREVMTHKRQSRFWYVVASKVR